MMSSENLLENTRRIFQKIINFFFFFLFYFWEHSLMFQNQVSYNITLHININNVLRKSNKK